MEQQKAWEIEKKTLDYNQKVRPDFLLSKKIRTEAEVFKEIGIFGLPQNRPHGYLRFYNQDFIVEEIEEDDEIIEVNKLVNSVPDLSGENIFIFANLIKQGLPTIRALQMVAESLGLQTSKIGYAGLKDEKAITAQIISVSKKIYKETPIKDLALPNILLTNFRASDKRLWPGYLKGNLFTITIRTKEKINPKDFEQQLQNIKEEGMLNYYQSQRFEETRLIAHKLGRLILQGNFEGAIKNFLFETNNYDRPIVNFIRIQGEKLFPQWEGVKRAFMLMPFTLIREIKILEYLEKNPKDYKGALGAIFDQTQMWIYAYASLLFNKYISEKINSKDGLREEIPLLLHDDKNLVESYYGDYLKEDKILNLENAIAQFNFMKLSSIRFNKTLVYPDIKKYFVKDNKVVIKFSLPKGCYATAFLAHLFELFEGSPSPDWVNKEKIDAKQILGDGSLEDIKNKLNIS